MSTQNALFLYEAGGEYTFMLNDTSEMQTLDGDDIDEVTPYLKENLDCFLMMHEGNVI